MSGFVLKIIACISMLIDHTGETLFPEQVWMRYAGRLAFPIFCFLLVEGYHHSRNVKRYLIRLFLFALLSEIPFNLMSYGRIFYTKSQNVIFTLFLGLLMLYLLDWTNSVPLKALVVLSVMVCAEEFHFNYRYPGIFIILSFHLFRDFPLFAGVNVIAANFRLFYAAIQTAGSLSVLPVSLYNGEKGPDMKYFFYLFYPLHMLMIYLIKNTF